MLLKNHKEVLSRHLETVEKALPGKTTMPILNNIFLERNNGNLIFMSTNMEIGIRSIMTEETQEFTTESDKNPEKETVLIPSKIIDIIRHLPAEREIEINIDGESYNIEISNGESKFNLKGINAEEYPVFEEQKPEKKPLVLKEKQLRNMIRKTVFAASTDESRPAFTGVLFLMEDNRLSLIASDTYRLVMEEKEIEPWEYEINQFLIPSKSLKELLKLLSNDDGEVVIFPVDNQLVFSFGHVLFVSRLLEDKFPDFRKVIPADILTKIIINKDLFEDIMARAALLSDNLSKGTRLILKDDILQVTASSEQGKMEEDMALVNKEGEDVNILLNIKFLTDVLKVVESENIEIEFSGQEAPAIIRPENEKNYLYLVLPIKVEQPL